MDVLYLDAGIRDSQLRSTLRLFASPSDTSVHEGPSRHHHPCLLQSSRRESPPPSPSHPVAPSRTQSPLCVVDSLGIPRHLSISPDPRRVSAHSISCTFVDGLGTNPGAIGHKCRATLALHFARCPSRTGPIIESQATQTEMPENSPCVEPRRVLHHLSSCMIP